MTNTETRQQLPNEVGRYLASAHAENTKRAYRADWRAFNDWCTLRNYRSLPVDPGTVALYISKLADDGFKVSTIARRLVTIEQFHHNRELSSPVATALVQTVFRGIQRKIGTKPEAKKPILLDDLRAMLAALPNNLAGLRDKALLLVGFAGAFRRSELVNIDVEDLATVPEGFIVHVQCSKTDPYHLGRNLGIPYGNSERTCPVNALETWLTTAGLATGPVFRPIDRYGHLRYGRLSGRAVARIVKRCASRAGLDKSKFCAHSLRAGFATSAAIAGVSERAIMKQTGHKSTKIVRRYIHDGQLFQQNAASTVF